MRRARLGDISRFEPTKSGAERSYAKSPQNIRRRSDRDGGPVGSELDLLNESVTSNVHRAFEDGRGLVLSARSGKIGVNATIRNDIWVIYLLVSVNLCRWDLGEISILPCSSGAVYCSPVCHRVQHDCPFLDFIQDSIVTYS